LLFIIKSGGCRREAIKHSTRYKYIHIHIDISDFMSKLISVSDAIYADLMKIKGKKSFTEVIAELLKRQRKDMDLMDFFGSMPDIDAEKWKKEIRDQRNFTGTRKFETDD